MSIKEILVQVDDGPANQARLELALSLAKQHAAYLVALHVFDVALAPSAAFGAINVEDSLALLRWQEQLSQEANTRADRLRSAFHVRLWNEQVAGEWRFVEGNAAHTITLHARYADMTILGQQDPRDDRVSSWTHVLESTLLGSGRPLLVVPHAGQFETVGRRALVGWNARREAARAIHDALPLLHGAESVTVLSIDAEPPQGAGNDPVAEDITRHLIRHGLPATTRSTCSDRLDPATLMLNFAADLGSDLIVIGGYGHSRIREIVLGGMTRTLLQHAPIPVLLSH